MPRWIIQDGISLVQRKLNIKHPNFLVVGAQKCGTSYLCALLAEHKDVFHTTPKEPLFFQRPGLTPEKFRKYLNEFYSAADGQKAIGEGSTVYFQWPNALDNIRTCLGHDLKIFICLRHPTDRAVSFYLHNLRKGRIRGTERIYETGENIHMSPVLSSKYASHLKRWLDEYGDRVKILYFDDLLASPTAFMRQATDFLDITPLGEIKKKAVNRGFDLAWRDGCLTLNSHDQQGSEITRFTMSDLEHLHSLFLDDIDRTQVLLGKSLANWKLLPEFTAKQSGW